MNKKGINTVITMALIIAIVVTIAALIFLWSVKFSKDVQDKADLSNKGALFCSNAEVKIKYACMGTNLIVMLENKGQAEIDIVNMRVLGSSGTYQNLTSVNLPIAGISKVEIAPGEIGSIKKIETVPVSTFGEQRTCKDYEAITNVDVC